MTDEPQRTSAGRLKYFFYPNKTTIHGHKVRETNAISSATKESILEFSLCIYCSFGPAFLLTSNATTVVDSQTELLRLEIYLLHF